MKNKIKLNTKITLKFCAAELIWTLIFVSLPNICHLLLNMDFQWLYDISNSAHYLGNELLYGLLSWPQYMGIITAVWLLGTAVIFYLFSAKIAKCISATENAIESISCGTDEYITLPKELIDIERSVNEVKQRLKNGEKASKESEQRKNDLIVYLAHDIKTPLTSVIGYLSLLDELPDMPEAQRQKYISTALKKSYRLEDLINELFDIARFNSEKMVLVKEELDLTLMLEQIIDDFFPLTTAAGKNIIFEPEESIKIFADSDKLSRVFNNIIKNAICYGKDNTPIHIKTEVGNTNVTVKISNSGKEISGAEIEKIFEKFYRLDPARSSQSGGSGLGLAIARNIVELHSGTLNAESDKNETVFTVTLPLPDTATIS